MWPLPIGLSHGCFNKRFQFDFRKRIQPQECEHFNELQRQSLTKALSVIEIGEAVSQPMRHNPYKFNLSLGRQSWDNLPSGGPSSLFVWETRGKDAWYIHFTRRLLVSPESALLFDWSNDKRFWER